MSPLPTFYGDIDDQTAKGLMKEPPLWIDATLTVPSCGRRQNDQVDSAYKKASAPPLYPTIHNL